MTTYEKPLRTLGKRHDVMMVELADPREHEFPNVGLIRLFDPESGQTHFVDTSAPDGQRQFALMVQRERAHIRQTFRRFGLDHATVLQREDVPKTMVRLLSRGGGGMTT